MQSYIRNTADVVVVGAGHAGCEAALAAAKLGKKTVLLAISLESVADMPCNPNIGGTGKGHLVREIDALGGMMGQVIDETFLQSRMLNQSKGPAIHSLRVQADKRRYHEVMKQKIEQQENLYLMEGEVREICVEDQKVTGVLLATGAVIQAQAVILCTGTYLNAKILMGEWQYSSGPHGMKPAEFLTDSLRALEIPLLRFKTGTPPRIYRRSVDFSKLEEQKGDQHIIPFSFMNEDKEYDPDAQMSCYLTHTTLQTRQIIEENLHRSPMYAGEVHGVGPRYCPSIEDKMVRFPDRSTHQVFLEPEGANTEELYVQGVSSTLPEEVQLQLLRTIEGLENVEMMRSAYGIEYDCIDARALYRTLECRHIEGLYFAGQMNGSSGYEEAGAQGLMAGINAARKLDHKEPFILDRSQAYIGVLIDDLVTSGTNEPYRMMTSRCEYRLSLRQNNADLRLTRLGYEVGLCSEERYQRLQKKEAAIQREKAQLQQSSIPCNAHTEAVLQERGLPPLKNGLPAAQFLRRPEVDYDILLALGYAPSSSSPVIREEVQTEIKYEGYIQKQQQQILQFQRMEKKKLPSMDYAQVKGLKKEAVQKLNAVQPESVGQASRISGVSPADISVLLIYLEMHRRHKDEDEK